MQNIYNFEAVKPPVVTEAMLQKELRRRELNIQVVLLYISSVLMSFMLAFMAIITAKTMLFVALCFAVMFFVQIFGFVAIGVCFFIKQSKNHDFIG